MPSPLLLPPCLEARRAVRGLIQVVGQVAERAAVRLPLVFDHEAAALLIVWTVLRWERTFLIECLEGLGVDMWRLTCDVDAALKGRRQRDAQGDPRWAIADADAPEFARSLQVGLSYWLDLAEGQSHQSGHPYLGTEHLLLAILASPPPALAEVFARHGLDRDRVQGAVLAALANAPPAAAADQEAPSAAPSAWAAWDTPAAGVPRRFGLGVLLLITTMFAMLYAGLQVLGAPPVVFVMVVVLFAAVGAGQMLLFRGKYPRAASIWVGAFLFPIETAATLIYLNSAHSGLDIDAATILALAIAAAPLGAGFGYLAGGLTAGVFYLLERFKKRPPAIVELEEVDSSDTV